MRCAYFGVERLNEHIVRVDSPRYGAQLVVMRRLRKTTECAGTRCGHVPLLMGTNAYATMNSSTMNRMDRLCTECAERGSDGRRLPLPDGTDARAP